MNHQNSNSRTSPSISSSSFVRLFFVSVLILFLEMLLIRWVGTEIRIFAYVQNIVLVVCFLGLGLGVGCSREDEPATLTRIIIPLSLLVASIELPVLRLVMRNISNFLSALDDTIIWYKVVSTSPTQELSFVIFGSFLSFVLLFLVFKVFEGLGSILGHEFSGSQQTTIKYSVNIAGSLLGCWLFALLAYLSTPPFVWIVCVSGMLFLTFVTPIQNNKIAIFLLFVPLIPLLFPSDEQGVTTLWSPYQKLSISTYADSPNGKQIQVNNVGYQLILDLSEKNTSAHPEQFPSEYAGLSHYDIPFHMQPNHKNVLIVGAGSGNDAAGAIRNGAERVTAVEIDPKIIELGKKLHLEHPYQSDRVRVVIDDARAFLQQTSEHFDLIIFGLLDAHTGNSLTNTRLDHFIYTREAIALAKSKLTEKGTLCLSFGMGHPFILSRIYTLLTEAFEKPPLVFFSGTAPSYGWGGTMFVAGDETLHERSLKSNPLLEAVVNKTKVLPSKTELVPTDNWPYLYLPSQQIPSLYYLLGAIVLIIFFLNAGPQCKELLDSWSRKDWHFFFLGSAFLLLETQNISKAALLFANTWIVNLAVVSGVMIMTLIANFIYSRGGIRVEATTWLGLIISCLLLLIMPLQPLLYLPFVLRIIAYGCLVMLPVLFSALLFIKAFDNSESPHRALAVNLLGALVGGLLQSLSFVIGMYGLFLLTIGIYIAAVTTRRSSSR